MGLKGKLPSLFSFLNQTVENDIFHPIFHHLCFYLNQTHPKCFVLANKVLCCSTLEDCYWELDMGLHVMWYKWSNIDFSNSYTHEYNRELIIISLRTGTCVPSRNNTKESKGRVYVNNSGIFNSSKFLYHALNPTK